MLDTMLCRFVLSTSSRKSACVDDTCGRLMVGGRAAPRWACSFWELMGRKKACDVSEGTWLLLVELAGRCPIVEPLVLPVKLTRFWESPRRRGVGPRDDAPVRAVPGRDAASEW